MTQTLNWPGTNGSHTGLIDGPAGGLEVTVDSPETSARGVVPICHPHPQYGGTKDNKVVYMMARAAVQAGLSAVRFNFRGVGESAGRYDEGNGEIDDARAVRDWAMQSSGLPLAGVAGFSFGAVVAVRIAATDGVPALVTVGLPAEYFDRGLPRPDCAWLALFGDADDVIEVEEAIAAVRALEPAVDVQILESAGHFLHGRLSELRKRVFAYWQHQVSQ